jgi:hypothetical protein
MNAMLQGDPPEAVPVRKLETEPVREALQARILSPNDGPKESADIRGFHDGEPDHGELRALLASV